jgi:hypothetical protein
MMKIKQDVSNLLLERYRLGEMSRREQRSVEAALRVDATLRRRLDELEDSDREIRRSFPAAAFPGRAKAGSGRKRLLWAAGAAALLLCALVPALNRLRERRGMDSDTVAAGWGADRAKGAAEAGLKPELFVYLKDDHPEQRSGGGEIKAEAVLRAGNTVQLAYLVPSAQDRYGVIFSIDGRAAVTLHYPYREGQSSLLEAGKRVFLREAYTLDDAPHYETFFMVVSDNPLDSRVILKTAHKLAPTAAGITAGMADAFADCEVESITILKE